MCESSKVLSLLQLLMAGHNSSLVPNKVAALRLMMPSQKLG